MSFKSGVKCRGSDR